MLSKSKISVKNLNIRFISFVLLCVGVVCLLAAVWFSPYVQNNRYVKAWKLDRQANKFPAGSNEYARFHAMANAVRSGQTNYTYTPNFNPMGGGGPVPGADIK